MLTINRSGNLPCNFLVVVYERVNQLFIAVKQLQHVYGVSCAIGASALFAVANLFVYAAGTLSNPFMVIVFDANISTVCCVVVVALKRPRILPRLCHAPGLFFCGFIQTLAQFALLFGIIQIGPANATTLSYTMPIFALVFGYIFINAELHWSHFVFTISSIVGAALVSRAYLESSSIEKYQDAVLAWIGILAALASASGNAGVLIILRKLSYSATAIDSIFVVLAYTVQYSIASLIVCFVSNSWSLPQSITDVLILSGSGPTAFVGTYLCYLTAYVEHPTYISIILTLTVVLVFVGQIAIFNIQFHWMSLAGSILIMVACVGVAALSMSENHNDEGEEGGVSLPPRMEESDTLLKGEMSGKTPEKRQLSEDLQ